MATLIAACGLDCTQCESYQATQSNDLLALGAVVEKWSREYHASGLTVENIQCDGCMSAGHKVDNCSGARSACALSSVASRTVPLAQIMPVIN
jgi:hypothetical protein